MIGYFPTVWAQRTYEIHTLIKGELVVSTSPPQSIAIVEPQPVRENDLRMLEPGERLSDFRVTWTAAAVDTTDRITYNGQEFRAHTVEDRGEFRRVIMRRMVADVA